MVVKDFFIGFFIIVFVENPYLQVIPTIIVFVIAIALLIKYKPYSSKLLMVSVVFNEIVYTVVITTYLFYNIVKEGISSENRRKYFGYGLVAIVALAIIFNLSISLIEIIRAVKAYCDKKKNGPKDQKNDSLNAKVNTKLDESQEALQQNRE